MFLINLRNAELFVINAAANDIEEGEGEHLHKTLLIPIQSR